MIPPDSAYHLFVIRVSGHERDGLKEFLASAGIETIVITARHPSATCYRDECLNLRLDRTDACNRK